MLAYYRRSLITLFSQVHELRIHPWDNPQKCLAIQETLIQKIIYAEKRIRDLKKYIKEHKRQLGTKRPVPLSKEEAGQIKESIEIHQQSIVGYEHLLSVLRSVGDALAFIYLLKWDIKPLTFKETAGFISGKAGFKVERQVLRLAFEMGAVAILNDLTNCLRYGDIMVMREDRPALFMEIKSSVYHSKRTERQQAELEKVAEYLHTDTIERNGYHVTRVSSHQEARDYVVELNQLVTEALKVGFGFVEIEKGLSYYVEYIEAQYDQDRLKSIVQGLKNPPMAFYLNMFKYSMPGYYPFSLLIRDPEAAFEFYNGRLLIFVFIDPETISARLSRDGLKVKFENNEKWAFSVTHTDPERTNDFGPMQVGQYFWGRVACEFLSLDWFLDEIIYRFNHAPMQEKESS